MDSVEEIKQRLEVDDVVGGYLQLKPAGRNLKGLCPFHHEKTSSFMVSPEKGIYHCFGCNEGGDIFEFVMKMEGLDFRGALELLAQRAGVELKYGRRGTSGQSKENLYKICELAAKYYHLSLSRDQRALDYVLANRGFSKDIIKKFMIGYAPNAQTGLVSFLQKQGFKKDEIVKAGLGKVVGTGLRDVFRHRITVPLRDGQGRTVGFTARVLDDSLPKYINTAQTAIYDKSRLLFGLDLAKDSIRERDEAVVVEGNLDVIASHQAGVSNVVASSGTALTAHQIKALSRFSKTIKLAFDQDSAGLNATERAIPLAQEAGAYLHIVEIADAKDPDELIRQDVGKWETVIAEAQYVMDWLLKKLVKEFDISTVTGKKQVAERFMGSLARLRDPVEQDHYVRQLASLATVDQSAIWRKLRGQNHVHAPETSKAPAYRATVKAKDENDIVQEAFLSLVLLFADTRTSLQDVRPEYFTSPERQELYSQLIELGDTALGKKIPSELKNLENYVKILLLKGEAHYQDWTAVDRRIEAFSLAQRLRALNIKNAKTKLSQQLKAAEVAGDTTLVQKLLEEYQALLKRQ